MRYKHKQVKSKSSLCSHQLSHHPQKTSELVRGGISPGCLEGNPTLASRGRRVRQKMKPMPFSFSQLVPQLAMHVAMHATRILLYSLNKRTIEPARQIARRTTRARNAQFRLRRELPAPGTKGGLFCACVESRNLT